MRVRWYGDVVAYIYKVEYASQSSGPFTVATTQLASEGTFYTVAGLANGQTYYFRVTEANAEGTWGAPSSTVSQIIGSMLVFAE